MKAMIFTYIFRLDSNASYFLP